MCSPAKPVTYYSSECPAGVKLEQRRSEKTSSHAALAWRRLVPHIRNDMGIINSIPRQRPLWDYFSMRKWQTRRKWKQSSALTPRDCRRKETDHHLCSFSCLYWDANVYLLMHFFFCDVEYIWQLAERRWREEKGFLFCWFEQLFSLLGSYWAGILHGSALHYHSVGTTNSFPYDNYWSIRVFGTQCFCIVCFSYKSMIDRALGNTRSE